jgi:SAM-dependent methyltransferase
MSEMKGWAQKRKYCVDYPKPGETCSGIIPLQGWVISSDKDELVRVEIDGKNVANLPIDIPRPDVLRVHPDIPGVLNCGFAGVTYSNQFKNGPHRITFKLRTRDDEIMEIQTFEINLLTQADRVTVPGERIPELQLCRTERQKSDRLRRLSEVFQCPNCGSKQLTISELDIGCISCDKRYKIVDEVPVFYLDPVLSAEPIGLVSANPYPDHVVNCIRSVSGLILDYGAGGRPYGYENVVQVEIWKYGFTDVVVDKHTPLPFKEDSFSAVISLAVIEHVTDPRFYVNEIERVLRPGGIAHIDSAFLQPVHAYPDHYFNTTMAGLKELFRKFEIVAAGVRPYQEPFYSLVWVLEGYRDRLPEPERPRFLQLTVDQLIHYLNQLKKGAYDSLGLRKITKDTIDQIAAGVYVEARKPK